MSAFKTIREKSEPGVDCFFEERQKSSVDIEGMADAERPAVFDCDVDGAIECKLRVFEGLAYLSYRGSPFLGKFKSGDGPAEECDAPAILEYLHLPADVGVAGMEALRCPAEVALFGSTTAHTKASVETWGNMFTCSA